MGVHSTACPAWMYTSGGSARRWSNDHVLKGGLVRMRQEESLTLCSEDTLIPNTLPVR